MPECKHVGPGLPACRWASARRGARPGKLLRQRGESCLDRIPFDVVLHSLAFFVVAYQMVIAFVLPEGAFIQTRHAAGFVSGEALQRAKPFWRRHARCDKKMNVIRHDDESVQFVAFESAFAFVEGLDYHFGDFGSSEKHRARFGTIEQLVHGEEGLPGCGGGWPEDAPDRKASVKAESYEYSFANRIPMRKAPFIPAHVGCSGARDVIVSGNFVKGCAGRKPRPTADA